VSVSFTIEFRDPSDLMAQLRDFMIVRKGEAKHASDRARTVRERNYFQGRADAFDVAGNLLDTVELKEIGK
jgi:hypothetical protein